jgi:hypothetical protein
MNNNIGESNNPEALATGKEISRRQFLETSAAGAAFTALGIGMAPGPLCRSQHDDRL